MSGSLFCLNRKQLVARHLAFCRSLDRCRIIRLASPLRSRKAASRFPLSDCLVGNAKNSRQLR